MNFVLMLEIAAGVFLGSIPAALFLGYNIDLQSQHLTDCLTRLNLIVASVKGAVDEDRQDVVQAIERLRKHQ
jgi:hypothetical protein